jgi:2-octaprenylphenol hydroxylase
VSRADAASAAAYDVVIVGGGMVGAALACAFGGSALKVAVIERQKSPEVARGEYDLRVSALTLATRAILEALGAWRGIEQRRYAGVAAMQVWDAGGSGEVRFDAAEIGEPYLAFIAENSVIVAALHERVQTHTNVHWVNGAIADVKLGDDAHVALADGRELRARLVVAADGAASSVREQVSIPVRSLDLRQHGIVATVRTARTHDDTARQRFLPTGPLAFLPLPEPHTSSIVWSADQVRAEQLAALDDRAFAGALTEAFGDRLGAIESAGARASFPLALAHAERYVAERVVLIGDAAHTVHPLAGQGVNLGFLDAAALAEVVLEAARSGRDIGGRHLLRRYERWRKGDNLAMMAVTGGFKFLFGNEWPLLTGLRNIGLSATDRMTPLKGLMMRRACGLTGDLPRLARRASGSIASAD